MRRRCNGFFFLTSFGNGSVAGRVDLIGFAGTALMRCDITQGGMEVSGIVPVNKIGVPGSGEVDRREHLWVSDGVFHRLVV